MNNYEGIEAYFDNCVIEPVEKKQILVTDNGRLETYGKVVVVGPDVKHTHVGDYIAFELWDVRDCSLNDKKLYVVSEQRFILKIPVSAIMVA